jgi:hypothetical protein
MPISVEGPGKNQLDPCQEGMGSLSIVILFFAEKILTNTDRCAGALSFRGNEPLVRHFPGCFLSTASPKATEDVNVHLLVHGGHCCKLYQRIPGTF